MLQIYCLIFVPIFFLNVHGDILSFNDSYELEEVVFENELLTMRKNMRELKKMVDLFTGSMKGLKFGLDNVEPDCSKFVKEPETFQNYRGLAASCAAAMKPNDENGVRKLYIPGSDSTPFHAYCMQDPKKNGKAWTVLLRRQDGLTNFERDFIDYEYGFGDFKGEYWIGLKPIHEMTYFRRHELWIQLKGQNGEINSKNTHFAIKSAKYNYELNVLGHQYGNDENDNLRECVGNRFSSKAQDFTEDYCVNLFRCSWWFSEKSNKYKKCTNTSLTGIFGKPFNKKGMMYQSFNAEHGALNYVLMAIRPVGKKL